ncbi:hypothetical protein ACHQM5_020966 [Ranunculus cassubicifolius]
MAQETPQLSTDLQNGESIQNGNTKAVTFSCIKVPLSIQAPKAAEAIQFYKSAFGAVEVNRENHPKRKADQDLPLILAADLQLGSSVFTIRARPKRINPVADPNCCTHTLGARLFTPTVTGTIFGHFMSHFVHGKVTFLLHGDI